MEIIQSSDYRKWIRGLQDKQTVFRINARILRIQSEGQLVGDYKPLGNGVYELRFFFGSGYRVYVTIEHGNTLLLLLVGGDKSSQSRDIEKAMKLANEWRSGNGN